ncbi:uncharacterized protein EDB91DRAFT_1233985 [Suillus paluster]|uniref:uncharacterized protein n=1 Tax=Suillus paluster TaxID=48578 RepID=UPI001B8655FE|nr:uncharacterized protein EDB91DRAFT_1233985 [Suillus paluster]KAG1755234.1 hypothetical protein EDB91DRAFT_1233985 [Suillus paluster]
MSVATRNPFALLDGPASRGGRYYQRGAAPAPATPPTDDQPPAPEPKQRRFDGERREGRGDGRGRGRGRGGDRGGDRGGRGRPFDRHSATGKTDSDKKLHNGWGGDDGETERKTEEAATIDAAADATGALNERERRGDREEEEDDTLTLDQYLAQQREKENALVPKLEVRKPNDGVDDDVFKGAAPITKKEDLEYFAAKTKSAPKARTKKDEKVFIEIEARFERPNRGGRGGRGGDRGGDRGSRGDRGGRGRGSGRGRGGANGFPTLPLTVVGNIMGFEDAECLDGLI